MSALHIRCQRAARLRAARIARESRGPYSNRKGRQS